MNKKLNTITISGLMIGPILGSGIVLLPPIAIKMLGDKAIIAWIIIMLMGIIFAYIFTKMSILTSSNEGVNVVVGEKLGQNFCELSSNYLTAAVCFGPVAVLYTASGFICNMIPGGNNYQIFVILILLLLNVLVLLMGITAMGRVTLVLSSLTGLILVIGSIFNLSEQDSISFPNAFPQITTLGSTLLLLFWAIIGWEVIGSYVEEVINPERTLMLAMKISLSAVIFIYLLTTFALQNSTSYMVTKETDINVSLILIPLFGNLSYIIMGIIAAGLCYSTLIMILGAVTRQMASRAEKGTLPAFLRKKEEERSPKRALILLTTFHCLVIVLIHYNYVTLEWTVGIANTFFICNALLGLIASLKCVNGILLKVLITLLIIVLAILLTFSPLAGWLLLLLVSLMSMHKSILNFIEKLRTSTFFRGVS
ncbi:APC family permease [Clostridium chromiireducens]|uniref:Inner membrane protein YjeH n=1 Tax=Clostridium chromiireducens TaxID=225345 RepID=A0A1V4IKI0_9CLOT|nr:APC family permease [Clostridium chromiireducens]OPJ60531.1 inner membrane protein YjeH [Clostridium chromiireducens]